MAKKGMNPKVDGFFSKAEKWQKELKKLRAIALGCKLTEELKWGNPCYTLEGGNIVLIHAFKFKKTAEFPCPPNSESGWTKTPP